MKIKYLGHKEEKILVTGGTGFIGKSLCNLIDNEKLYVAGKTRENNPPCDELWYYTNSLDEIKWGKKLKNLSVLFHLAANNNTLDEDEEYMMQANVYSPIRMFQKAVDAGCKNFVYASSTAIFGNRPAPYTDKTVPLPLTAYARSKVKFEQFADLFANAYDVSVTGLRFCNVYGTGEFHKGNRASMIYQIYKAIKKGENIKLFKSGEQKRCWLHVNDAATALLAAADRKKGSKHMVFNIGSHESVTFNFLVDKIIDRVGLISPIEYIENPNESIFQNHTECDIQPAKEFLNWQPNISISQGICNELLE